MVFYRLHLVMFFEGIRSERQLLRVAADRLSVRWYLGYDLGEPLPDHSSRTRIRDRYSLEVFRRFFEAIGAQCQQAGLVWGKDLYVDATKVEPTLRWIRSGCASRSRPISDASRDELATANGQWHDWFARDGQPDRTVNRWDYQRLSDFRASATDPDAGLMQTRGGVHPGYFDHYVIDGASCNGCSLKAKCTPNSRGRQVRRDCDEAYLELVRGYQEASPCQKAIRQRSVWVDPLFAEAKQWHGLRRFQLRRLRKVNGEALLTATG